MPFCLFSYWPPPRWPRTPSPCATATASSSTATASPTSGCTPPSPRRSSSPAFRKLKISFVHSGWGGDRVTGGGGGPVDVRLWRDVLPYNPTVMTIMLGMNDGRYRAYDQQIFDEFASGFKHIVQIDQARVPRHPHHRDPAFALRRRDPRAAVRRRLQPGAGALRRLPEGTRRVRAELGVADLNTSVVAALAQGQCRRRGHRRCED